MPNSPTISTYGYAYRITSVGVLTTLASFDLTDAIPVGGLDSDFYGTTSGAESGGGHGAVVRMTPGRALTPLFSFADDDGEPLWKLSNLPPVSPWVHAMALNCTP
jgi:hypothetical protein